LESFNLEIWPWEVAAREKTIGKVSNIQYNILSLINLRFEYIFEQHGIFLVLSNYKDAECKSGDHFLDRISQPEDLELVKLALQPKK